MVTMMMSRTMTRRGFTLIEMLVVLSVIGLLLSIAAPSYLGHIDRARDLALKQDLKTVRDSIDKFQADRGRDPTDLSELVTAHYLRELPVDPVTDSASTWVPVKVDGVGVHDLHSGAPGNGADGTPYASW
jgi:general secretion pathway protein G